MAGRKRDQVKDAYTMRYGLSESQRKRTTRAKIELLDRCKDDAARRLLLGVSK